LHLCVNLNEKTKPVNLFADDQISFTVSVLMLCLSCRHITFKCQLCTVFRHDGTTNKFAASFRDPVGHLGA